MTPMPENPACEATRSTSQFPATPRATVLSRYGGCGNGIVQQLAFPVCDCVTSRVPDAMTLNVVEFENGVVVCAMFPLGLRNTSTDIFARIARLAAKGMEIDHIGDELSGTTGSRIDVFQPVLQAERLMGKYPLSELVERVCERAFEASHVGGMALAFIWKLDFQARLKEFSAGLNPSLVAISMPRSETDVTRRPPRETYIDTRIYNFLTAPKGQARARRITFTQKHPVLADILSQGGGPEMEDIRRRIDCGQSVWRDLAQRFGVAPHTVRRFGTLPFRLNAFRRQEDALLTLDALCPEDRPINVDAWHHFARLTEAASAFDEWPLHSLLARAWCREKSLAARVTSPTGRPQVQAFMPRQTDEENVEGMRSAMLRALADRTELGYNDPNKTHPGIRIVDHWLLRQGTTRLATLAHRWRKRRAEILGLSGPFQLSATRSPSIIDAPVDMGERSLIQLLSNDALKRQGEAQTNCVARYSGRVSNGRSLIFSVIDNHTGKVCSTVEFEIVQTASTDLRLSVVQHFAERNRWPSKECRQAVADFVHLSREQTLQARLKRCWDWLTDLETQGFDQERIVDANLAALKREVTGAKGFTVLRNKIARALAAR